MFFFINNMFKQNILQYLLFTVIGSEGSLGGLGPALLVAIILNSYSCPLIKSEIFA